MVFLDKLLYFPLGDSLLLENIAFYAVLMETSGCFWKNAFFVGNQMKHSFSVKLMEATGTFCVICLIEKMRGWMVCEFVSMEGRKGFFEINYRFHTEREKFIK